MNERIKKLAELADGVFIHKLLTGAKQYTFLEKDLEKFAELIVKECTEVCTSRVGNSDYNTGRMHCSSDLKEHFGIKEN